MSFRGNTKAAANIYLTLSPEEGEWGFAVQLSTDLPGRHPSDSPMEKKKTKKTSTQCLRNQEAQQPSPKGVQRTVEPDEEDDESDISIQEHSFLATAMGPDWEEHKLTFNWGVGEVVDWNRVSAWLKKCHAIHHDTCPVPSLAPPAPGFRLVDVRKGCVSDAPPKPHCKYAALSYVWGQVSSLTLQATTDNISSLNEEGVIFQSPLPATIRDAIVACTKLEIPYLWVDQLCILQDRKEDKLVQLNAMDKIYSDAFVTLVALAGDSVSCGLPGVSDTHRHAYTITTQGIFMLRESETYSENVDSSRWITRAWTFQEGFLSRRLLLFSDTGVFYECGHGSDVCDESPNTRRKDPTHIYGQRHRFRLNSSFGELLKDYMSRDLSFPSDILNAFVGILNSHYGSNHYYGLPLVPFKEFNHAIHWTGEYEGIMRDPEKDTLYPTWSWISMTSRILLWDDEEPAGSLALWAIASADHDQTSLRILNYSSKSNSEWRTMAFERLAAVAVTEAWKEGCFSVKLPDVLQVRRTWQEQQNVIMKKWPSLDHLRDEAIGIGHIDSAVELKFPPDTVLRARQPGHILIHTQSIQVELIFTPDPPDGYSSIRLKTFDGDVLGCLSPGSTDLHRLWDTGKRRPTSSFHALALSVSYKAMEDLQGQDPYENGSAFNKHSLLSRDSQEQALDSRDYIDVDVFDEAVGVYGDAAGSGYSTDNEAHQDLDGSEASDLSGHSGCFSGLQHHHHLKNQKDVGPYIAFTVSLMIVETGYDGISKRVGLGRTFLKIWAGVDARFETFVLA